MTVAISVMTHANPPPYPSPHHSTQFIALMATTPLSKSLLHSPLFPHHSPPSLHLHHHTIHAPPISTGNRNQSVILRARRKGRGRGAVAAMGLGGLLGGIFKGTDTGEGTRQRYAETVRIVNGLEAEMEAMTDAELRERTGVLRERARRGESLDALLPEAFAVVREASKRVIGLRPFDVQLIGGMVLHKGEIAEMRTGEGKTLVAILPAYLNALTGEGVHVVTVNDYLARRDCEWVGQVPRFLGLKRSCGIGFLIWYHLMRVLVCVFIVLVK
ncbi:hypothetical protein Droror1_Dr00003764 [Drosera rotundifolia]